MKKLLCILLAVMSAPLMRADDLSAVVTDADFGMSNGSVTLIITGGIAPYTVTWTGPGGFVSTGEEIGSLGPGDYCAEVTDAYCGTAELCVTVGETQPTSVHDNSDLFFDASPNPFSGTVVVRADLPGDFSGSLSLRDMTGRTVYEEQVHWSAGVHSMELSLPGDLAGGVYSLELADNTGLRFTQILVHGR